jgi:hypothetical protein
LPVRYQEGQNFVDSPGYFGSGKKIASLAM